MSSANAVAHRRHLPVMDSLQDIVALAEARSDVFVRYSSDPFEDTASASYDFEADQEMPGLSVTVLRPEPWWTRPAADWIARRICKYLDLAEKDPDKRPWLLTGRIVGNGPDHEPLVSDVEPIAWVGATALTEAERRYRQRFKVGNDSTGQHH